MQERIVRLLKERRPNATTDWQAKLPQMAKRLEEALYSNANSLDEYGDVNTLKSRLQQYAMSVGNRNAQANRTPMNPQHGQPPQQNFGPGISQQQQRIMGGVQQNVNTRPPGVGMAANSNAGQYFLQPFG